MKNNILLRWVLGGVGLCLIVACGAKKSSSSSASRSPSAPANPTGNYKLGECNRVSVSGASLSGQVGTYYEPTTRVYREDYLNLNITDITNNVFTSDNHIIQFYRWTDTGTRITNQVPVRIFFVDKLTGAVAGSNVDRITKSTLEAAKSSFGSGWNNVSLTQFFQRALVVLTGMDFQYHGMTIAYYNTGAGTAAAGTGDILLPPFYANPNVYRTYYPRPSLYSLHPNYNFSGTNGSENDYWNMIEDICRQLSGVGTRIPAAAADTLQLATWPRADREPLTTRPLSFIQRVWQRIIESLITFF